MPGILNQIFEGFFLIIRWILSPINHLFIQERIGNDDTHIEQEKIPHPSEESVKKPDRQDASTSGKAGAGESIDEEFAKEGLRHHNEYRRKHGVPDLKLSSELNQFSKQWAKVLAKKEALDHRQDNDYGENISLMYWSNASWKTVAEEACKSWYDEIKDHDYASERMGRSGHFTQMIWKSSVELGFSMEKSKSGKIFVVANYNPPGNVVGKFSDNVPPPKYCTDVTLSTFCDWTSGGSILRKTVLRGCRKGSVKKPDRQDASTSGNAGAGGSVDEEFAKEGLRHHNEYRRKHGVPDLKLSSELNNFSKKWAKVLAKKEVMEHRPNNDYGENIYFIYSPNVSWKTVAEKACKSWYDEIKDHDYSSERMGRSGHFTQMIWKSSVELGFSMEKSKSGKIFVVANYNPPGNMVGKFSDNVPPPK
ncbi:repressed by EFG1 protein 1-like [Ischnura elegans]|uniref:repressed by EFG1 protein 1-like n=1 Tax=Ischnura elegans TaxID=197161 RepID=UPI001ED8A4BB|nr:repressed by EFG1 protein 1-like [Ischnura elegans]